ncbi:unnamed protein product [Adineta ricciae]|uniref:Uncharacterized protein n=1 Tax=Adineta ricciae TaxID=249248 RepID=A0A815CGY7_ADIRI|nr:unnamed protein product [Adineta ricciae]CAF1404313.1 unnamed protein product [Adineta ricciae]
MGVCVSRKIQIDPTLVDEINNIIDSRIIRIPTNYIKEHDRIVSEMEKASPEHYEGLLFSEYPEKNSNEVHKLSLKYVTSEEVKKEISDETYKQIEPKLEEQIKDNNAVVQESTRQAAQKLIEQTVEESVDMISEKIKTDEKPRKQENK